MQTQYRLETLSTVSDPGAPERANEDRLVAEDRFGLVIDGATGLGEERLLPWGDSDAAWLADSAAELMRESLQAEPPRLADLIREVNGVLRGKVADGLTRRAGDGPRRIEDAPAYALPTAAFQAARLAATGATAESVVIETIGLGDCALLVLAPDGAFWRTTGSGRPRGSEQEAARRALSEGGGLDGAQGFLRRPEVLAQLRASRARHNTPGGEVWTLGVAPEAAAHVVFEQREISAGALLLLATDGLVDLVDLYALYDGPGLLRAAAERGLPALLTELRRVERELDPAGERYPRFKQSDDATGVLCRISPA